MKTAVLAAVLLAVFLTGASATPREEDGQQKGEEVQEQAVGEEAAEDAAPAEASRENWEPDAPLMPPWPRKQRVILLENEDGSVGEVGIASEEGSATLNSAGQAADFANPEEVYVASDEELQELLGRITAVAPSPEIFELYFTHGVKLEEDSAALLLEVVEVVRDRPVSDVTIVGHTDRSGSEEFNSRLSLHRASLVRDALIEAGVDETRLKILGYGESKPAVETADGVVERANRRVEVRIR